MAEGRRAVRNQRWSNVPCSSGNNSFLQEISDLGSFSGFGCGNCPSRLRRSVFGGARLEKIPDETPLPTSVAGWSAAD